jgi:hypothetical protein
MQDTLIKKLHNYLKENNPDVLVLLEEEKALTTYLENKVALVNDIIQSGKPGYIIEEECINILTRDLRPSRFNYLAKILEEEFEGSYKQFQNSGVLQFELINLINHCNIVFKVFDFSEANEDDSNLRYAIIESVNEYLTNTRV